MDKYVINNNVNRKTLKELRAMILYKGKLVYSQTNVYFITIEYILHQYVNQSIYIFKKIFRRPQINTLNQFSFEHVIWQTWPSVYGTPEFWEPMGKGKRWNGKGKIKNNNYRLSKHEEFDGTTNKNNFKQCEVYLEYPNPMWWIRDWWDRSTV